MNITILPFFQGLGTGFAVAAIMGPIAILCIRRTLTDGQAVGLAIGLGAALADAMYALVAGFGLTLISDFLVSQQQILKFFGGVFLLYFGLRIFLEKPAMVPAAPPKGTGLIGIALSIFLLTLSNPATILSFVAIFAGLGVGAQGDFTTTFELVFGVFIGSAAWFTILTTILSFFRKKISPSTLVTINKVSGALIMIVGAISIASILIIKTVC